jgi:hypothetical protein
LLLVRGTDNARNVLRVRLDELRMQRCQENERASVSGLNVPLQPRHDDVCALTLRQTKCTQLSAPKHRVQWNEHFV